MGTRPATSAADRASPAARRSDDPRQAVLLARPSEGRAARGIARYSRPMVGQRRRVMAASALSAAAGGLVWVALLTAGLSAAVATAVACVTAFGLASVAAWRVDNHLFRVALAYAFAFILLESPIWIVLVLVLNPSGD